MSTTERIVERLRAALATTGTHVESLEDRLIGVAGSPKPGRRITVYVRDDLDFDVAFHVPEKQSSPLEQVIVGPAEEVNEVQSAVVQFVTDLVCERLILLMDKRLIRGGRKFMMVSEMSPSTLKHASWIASWRGTYDSDAPAA